VGPLWAAIAAIIIGIIRNALGVGTIYAFPSGIPGGNAYYGVKLTEDYGTGISDHERRLVKKLVTYMDYVIRLGDFC